MEAKGKANSMLNRKCVVVRWVELSQESLTDLISRGAGSILVLLPQGIDSMDLELIKVCELVVSTVIS